MEYERRASPPAARHEIEHLDGHMYYEKAEGRLTEDEVDEIMQKAEEEKA